MIGWLERALSGLVRRWLHWGKRHWALVVLTTAGLVGLHDGLGAVAFAVPAIAIAVDLLARVSQFVRALGLVLGTIVVPWLCLLGFDVLLESLVLSWRPL